MEIKSIDLKLRENQIAKGLGCSSSTLQRYRQDEYMLSPYRMPPKRNRSRPNFSNTDLVDKSYCGRDIKGPQMTSKMNSTVSHTTNTNFTLKGGFMHEVGEINDEYFDESLPSINL